ncbi:hypothetical protein L211DRAFT_845940 [Terfezia boudieri ATCC MYA-4762]|uniref:Uncharacterized protein n=1 Tax=Terfezia boudieri ATCC MYA-4762 TaxID=1051890 RepID=A0A3N4M1X6_9PEZI|nr:hypothetical protein L211DRAFT_845940 [Terfezia boudieri ATCC MYA-4762]
MDQHLREGALLYLSNNKQWNFGHFLNHLDTIPSFYKDKKSRSELGPDLWRSLLMNYARDNSTREENRSVARTGCTKNTVIANPNYTAENNSHIQQYGKTPFSGHPDLVVLPRKSPIFTSSLTSPTLQSVTGSPRIEIARALEQVQYINCINSIEATPLPSASSRGESAVVDLSGLDCGDFLEIVGDDTAELLAAFEFGGTVAQLSLATDYLMEHRVMEEHA